MCIYYCTTSTSVDMKAAGRMDYRMEAARSSGLMVVYMSVVGARRMGCSNKEVPTIHLPTPVHRLPEIQRASSPPVDVILR